MRSPARIALALFAALVTSASADAHAYCRASTCAEGQLCGPPPWDDPICKPLVWLRPCVGVSVQIDASEEVPFDAAEAAVDQAFRTWEQPACDDVTLAEPGIRVLNLGAVECNLVEYNSNGGNANVVAFRDAAWPHPAGPHNIALTTVTFDTRTGEIYDADMEVNTYGFPFTTSDNPEEIQTDLLSVLTHEAGHFLGLAHAEDTSATMWPNYTEGETGPRDLSPDDIEGICAIYPPPAAPIDVSTCNPIPRHGFSPACLANQTEGDCSIGGAPGAPGGTRGEAPFAIAALVLALRSIRAKSARRAP